MVNAVIRRPLGAKPGYVGEVIGWVVGSLKSDPMTLRTFFLLQYMENSGIRTSDREGSQCFPGLPRGASRQLCGGL